MKLVRASALRKVLVLAGIAGVPIFVATVFAVGEVLAVLIGRDLGQLSRQSLCLHLVALICVLVEVGGFLLAHHHRRGLQRACVAVPM